MALTDLKQALKFLERNQTRFPFHDLVNAIFPLEQAEKAFEVGREFTTDSGRDHL